MYSHLGTLPGSVTRLVHDERTGVVVVATTNKWATAADGDAFTDLTARLVDAACEMFAGG